MQSCTTQTFYENRTTGYNVVYEYAGKQYSVQMPNDPGPFVKLQITPVGATPPQAPVAESVTYTQPVYVAVQPAPYPAYYARPYYAPIGVNLNLGWSNGYYGHGHSHWR
jgi:hypothetical protein